MTTETASGIDAAPTLVVRDPARRTARLVRLSSDFYWETDAEHRLTELVHGFRVACLIATHNLEIAKRMDRVVTIREGVLEEVSVG